MFKAVVPPAMRLKQPREKGAALEPTLEKNGNVKWRCNARFRGDIPPTTQHRARPLCFSLSTLS
jgi:hypothetical protein